MRLDHQGAHCISETLPLCPCVKDYSVLQAASWCTVAPLPCIIHFSVTYNISGTYILSFYSSKHYFSYMIRYICIYSAKPHFPVVTETDLEYHCQTSKTKQKHPKIFNTFCFNIDRILLMPFFSSSVSEAVSLTSTTSIDLKLGPTDISVC